MNAITLTSQPKTSRALAQVIEPLASYICAADQPREALLAALAVLFDEVQETNQVALAHVCQRADSLGLAS